MGVIETFSKRRRRLERAGKSDVYRYDVLPEPFRVQVIYIWRDAIGPYYLPSLSRFNRQENGYWRIIHDTLAREKGTFALAKGDNPQERCQRSLLNAPVEDALALIELSFRVIDRIIRGEPGIRREFGLVDPDDAIQELNIRFREHGIGYEYEGGELVRIDSQYVHEEAVRPAISLLHDANFRGAEEEFLRAHQHYRQGNHKEAIGEALKAFESTMKAICAARKWPVPPNATAWPLIDVIFKNGLLPAELLSHFNALRSVMESGLPTVRNKAGGHGQGAQVVDVPSYVAAYALHLAASNIVFLVEAHKAKR